MQIASKNFANKSGRQQGARFVFGRSLQPNLLAPETIERKIRQCQEDLARAAVASAASVPESLGIHARIRC
jgi:hypothetical protein